MGEGEYEAEWMLVAEVMAATPRGVPVWRTKDGRKIIITDMTDDHAFNSLRMVQRRIASLQLLSLEVFPPPRDGAEDYGGDFTVVPLEVCRFWVRAFRAELTRRGFKFPGEAVPQPGLRPEERMRASAFAKLGRQARGDKR